MNYIGMGNVASRVQYQTLGYRSIGPITSISGQHIINKLIRDNYDIFQLKVNTLVIVL